ncbi:hypothetical protein CVT26_010596 [Gymnopilus dilepis]|uniref:Uncharacterized protein n=1 Tax=Gymnopilus dilepis TaxID=231916 RepID=A0A409VZD8_9AGAR|nr:hypothetical protein CVT26_010596 [Gymnopilus dilepis]
MDWTPGAGDGVGSEACRFACSRCAGRQLPVQRLRDPSPVPPCVHRRQIWINIRSLHPSTTQPHPLFSLTLNHSPPPPARPTTQLLHYNNVSTSTGAQPVAGRHWGLVIELSFAHASFEPQQHQLRNANASWVLESQEVVIGSAWNRGAMVTWQIL